MSVSSESNVWKMGKLASLAIKVHAGKRFNLEGAVSGTAHPNQNHSNWWHQNKKVESMESKSGGDRHSILSRTAKIVIAKNLGEKVTQPESSLEDCLQLAILHPTPPSLGTWRRIWMFWAENCCKTCPSKFFSRSELRLTQQKGPKNGAAPTWPLSGTKVHSQGTVWTQSKTYEPLFRKKSISCQKLRSQITSELVWSLKEDTLEKK